MNDGDAFEAERRRLTGLAYRITGDRAGADDIVQEVALRWHQTDPTGIDRPAAWLTTVTSRLALDRLRSAQRRRETYVGPYLPDAVATDPDPEAAAELAESLTMGFMAMLERLSPLERVVFLLADVFDVPFQEIAATAERSPAACRQIASRARRRIRQERVRFAPTDADAWRVAEAFAAASVAGDLEAMLALVHPELVVVSDGGAEHHAARRPVLGAERGVRLIANLAQRVAGHEVAIKWDQLNGQPGFVLFDAGRPASAMVVSVFDGAIEHIWIVANPDKVVTTRAPIS